MADPQREFADKEEEENDVCYFHRDLRAGTYGADVSCLQRYLKREGYFFDEDTGYFGLATQEALSQWQIAHRLLPAKGVLGFNSRKTFAKLNSVPPAEYLRAMEHRAEVSVRKYTIDTCIQVESEELCLHRSVTTDATYEDRMHLCQEACQIAMGEACDTALPESRTASFKECLRFVPKYCKQNCQKSITK